MSRSPWFPLAGHTWRGMHNAGQTRPLAAGLVLAALALWLLPRATALSHDFLAGMVSAVAWVGLWWVQVEALLQQNRATLARLVPGHAQALRRSLVAQWLAFTALGVLLVAASLGAWDRWTAWAAGGGLLLFALTWLIRHPVLWLPVSVAFFGGLSQLRRFRADLVAARDAALAVLSDPLQGPLFLALGALVLGLLLLRAIGDGNGAHRRHTERRDRMLALNRAMQSGQGLPAKHQTGWTGSLHRLAALPWQALMARQLQPGVSPAAIGRLNLVLAGPSHWARQLGVALLVLLFVMLPLVALFLWLPPSRSGQSPMDAMRYGLCMGLFSMGLNPLMQLSGALSARRREQGLLMLAPGVPQGRALRDAWAAYQVRQFLIGWGLCTAGTWVLVGVFGSADAQRFVAGFAAGCLPLVRLAWRDWARLKDSGLRSTRSVQVASLAVLGGGTLTGTVAEKLALPSGLSLGLGVLAALTLGAWAWARRDRLPAPFPVGRLQG